MVEYEIMGRVDEKDSSKFKYRGGECDSIKNVHTRWHTDEQFNKHLEISDEYNAMLKRVKEYIVAIQNIFKKEQVGATLELKLNLPLKNKPESKKDSEEKAVKSEGDKTPK